MALVLPVTPVLMISPEAGKHMAQCASDGFPMVTGNSVEIAERLISLKRAKLSKPLVIGDISPLVAGRDIESRLLKVLEDLELDAIFFSSRDMFSPVILSRFAQVLKKWPVMVPQSDSKAAFASYMKSLQSPPPREEGVQRVLKEAPSFLEFFLQFQAARIPAKSKLLELI